MSDSGLSWGKEVIFNAQEEIFHITLGICDKYSIQFNSVEVLIMCLLYAAHNAK